jgi:hypothetical protein
MLSQACGLHALALSGIFHIIWFPFKYNRLNFITY